MITKLYNHQNFLIVFSISLFLCLIGSWAYPIYILDEAKNAEAAREMLVHSEFIVPKFNRLLRADKPPLHYYFMILGYKLFGVNAFGARFFSGIFGALAISISYYYINKFSQRNIAWIFVLVCWSSIFFIQEFHLAVPDPYLIFFISIGLWMFYDFYATSSKFSLWIMYVLFGLGTLTKGPVAIALPGLICIIFLVSTKNFSIQAILKFRPLLGLIVFLLVTTPWYILVHFETDGDWTKGFFLDHNVNRFGSKMEGHGGIFLITWAFVLLGLMPFSFFLLKAFKNSYINKSKDSLLLFSTIVSVVFIVFFSISGTKLPNYTMPCYPFLALVLAVAFWEFYRGKDKGIHNTIAVGLIGLLAIGLPIAGKLVLLQEKELSDVSDIAYWLIPTSTATLVGLVFYFKGYLQKAFITIALGWVIITPILFLGIYPRLTSRNPVEQAKSILKQNDTVKVYKSFDAAFPINFQRTFTIIHKEAEIEEYFEKHPQGFLMTNTREVDVLENRMDIVKIMEVKALFESHTTRIYKKK